MTRRGFSLIENLMAFTLIALVLILLLNLFPSSVATVRKSEQRYEALTLAGNLLEQQAARPFSKLVVGTVEESEVGAFKVRTEVRKVDGENEAWLKSIRVTVNWTYQEQVREVTRELRVHRLGYQQ